jgi:hypothetical protein
MPGSTVLQEISEATAPNLEFRFRKALAALELSWKASIQTDRFRCWLDWSRDGVRLGSGTLIAKQIAEYEPRVLSLLSFVFKRSFPVSVLNDLKKIEAMHRSGAISKANTSATESPIPPLLALDSARRLHIAVGLMDAGFLQPLDLLEMAGLDPVHFRSLEKYSPDQPRISAGQAGGGQWTQGEGGETRKPNFTPSREHGSPLDNKIAISGVLVGRMVDHKAEITHCTYSTPLGQFTIEYNFITPCDVTFPAPF